MENRLPQPDEGSGATRTFTPPPFDRSAAATELLDATLDWTQLQIAWFLLGTGEAELELALARLHRVQALLAWDAAARELMAPFPGPVYDDETIAELLAGVCG